MRGVEETKGVITNTFRGAFNDLLSSLRLLYDANRTRNRLPPSMDLR